MQIQAKPQEYDAIVVGSGASGGWAAKRMSEAGLRVALVCAGRPLKDGDYREHVQPYELKFKARANELMGLDDVTIVTWRRSCLSCHGAFGRGDGPQGAAVKARDLTDPAWQASVSDEELKRSAKMAERLRANGVR